MIFDCPGIHIRLSNPSKWEEFAVVFFRRFYQDNKQKWSFSFSSPFPGHSLHNLISLIDQHVVLVRVGRRRGFLSSCSTSPCLCRAAHYKWPTSHLNLDSQIVVAEDKMLVRVADVVLARKRCLPEKFEHAKMDKNILSEPTLDCRISMICSDLRAFYRLSMSIAGKHWKKR